MARVLAGKVVLVTGGGRGIGRECALACAREGAKVMVNDLGGSLGGGDEGEAGPASQVADEIRAGGGEAGANSDDVSSYKGAEGMVEQAEKELGELYGVISPAGILRDGMFHKTSEEDWDAVIRVHLKGTFNVCRASVEGMRERGEGRYVLFTSTSGLIGNMGQANYAAAKMGIAGLSRVLAMEGEIKGVKSNVVAPFAWTRMIESIPVKDEASRERVDRMRKAMRADQVAPLAVALASPGCEDSGRIYAVRGNEILLFSQPRPVRSASRLDGWDVSSVLSHGLPALRGGGEDLGSTTSVFTWEPI